MRTSGALAPDVFDFPYVAAVMFRSAAMLSQPQQTGVLGLASSFIMADLGIAHKPRAEHAAYIASWLEVLKNDPRAIFTAASKAQAAADWMQAQQPSADAAESSPDYSK